MKGLLLAAGLGTRFMPYTQTIPKPAIPLLNVPIAYYNLHLMQQMGLDQLTVNTHHLPGKIKNLFSDKELMDVPVHFSDETAQILGTGGAILKARKHLAGTGTFIMANADVVNGFSVKDALTFHHKKNPMATMIVMKHPEAGKKYGAVWVNPKTKEVISIGKEKPKDVAANPMHFVGVHFIEESVFKYIPKGPCDINKDVYLKAIAAGEKVLAFEKTGYWFDAGNLEDFLAATRELLGRIGKLQHQPFLLSLYRRFWKNFDRRPSIWEGENCEHLLDLGRDSQILLGNNCRLAHGTKVDNGFLVVGDDVVVDEGVKFKNVVIAPGAHVAPGSYYNTLII